MGRRYEMLRRCGQIRNLIEDNKYTKALEQIDALSLSDVNSVDDLYLFADIYEKAERFEREKEIYYLIYERTRSRLALRRLLRLVIRMGDMEEAGELFLTYEVVGGVTLDTFELRYLLARAEGEPRSRLIEILEELKKEEYTEEWGFQLARLYEQEGLREKCIQECKDLKLWFGEGDIVEKARALMAKCESDDWEPPTDEEIPEPELPDREAVFAYAAPPVEVEEMEDMEETVEPERGEPATSPQSESMEPEEPGEPVQLEAEAPQEAPQLEAEAMQEAPQLEPEAPVRETAPLYGEEGVSEPVVTGKTKTPKKPKTPKQKPAKSLEELLADEPEDVSEHGIHYYTLKGVMTRIKYNQGAAHFVFAGGEERITLAIAKRIAKELNHVGYFSARSIVKIAADKLNQLELSEQIEKVLGGCMLVTNAAEMNKKSVENLLQAIEENEGQIVIMLSGAFDEMDCFLGIYPELSEKMSYKIRM